MGNAEFWWIFVAYVAILALFIWVCYLHEQVKELKYRVDDHERTVGADPMPFRSQVKKSTLFSRMARFEHELELHSNFPVLEKLRSILPGALEEIYGTRKPRRSRAKVLADRAAEASGSQKEGVRPTATPVQRPDSGGKTDIPEGKR